MGKERDELCLLYFLEGLRVLYIVFASPKDQLESGLRDPERLCARDIADFAPYFELLIESRLQLWASRVWLLAWHVRRCIVDPEEWVRGADQSPEYVEWLDGPYLEDIREVLSELNRLLRLLEAEKVRRVLVSLRESICELESSVIH